MRRFASIVSVAAALACASVLSVPSCAAAGLRTRAQDESADTSGARDVIWSDPGAVESLDFTLGPGGAELRPTPPFTFVEEDLDGSNPKVKVTDANGRRWSVKFSDEESRAEVIATRLAWAAGYYVEPNYFLKSGRIEGARDLKRARKAIGPDGSFRDARFELKYETVDEKKGKNSWHWDRTPFGSTNELNGLKILVMLTSNWDNKDGRDASRGSNTAIHYVEGPSGLEARYLITDWGGSMGKWGGVFSREKWDCKGFARQTPDFVRRGDNGRLEWGYKGQHTGDFVEGINTGNVQWLMQYLGRVTDEQLRAGLEASGASPEEVSCYATALRERIEQLRRVAESR